MIIVNGFIGRWSSTDDADRDGPFIERVPLTICGRPATFTFDVPANPALLDLIFGPLHGPERPRCPSGCHPLEWGPLQWVGDRWHCPSCEELWTIESIR